MVATTVVVPTWVLAGQPSPGANVAGGQVGCARSGPIPNGILWVRSLMCSLPPRSRWKW